MKQFLLVLLSVRCEKLCVLEEMSTFTGEIKPLLPFYSSIIYSAIVKDDLKHYV